LKANRIVLRFVRNCSFAGSSREFGGTVVRIGRRSDNDLVFDPKRDLLVSGHHAEIRIDGGKTVIVDVGSKNGTYVNGERIRAPLPLMPGDRIELGLDGPEFRVELVTAAATGETQMPDSIGAGPVSRVRADDPTPPPSSMYRAPDGIPLDIPQPSTARRGKPRSRVALVTASLAIIGSVIAVVVATRDRGASPEPTKPIADVALPKTHRDAVYAIVVRDRHDGARGETFLGAGFAVAAGRLGTSARIAESVAATLASREVIARAGNGAELRIVAAQAHPGHREFATRIARYAPLNLDRGRFWSTAERVAALSPQAQAVAPSIAAPVACDVGVLELDPADAPRLAAALPLAAPARLADLASREPLVAFGYASAAASACSESASALVATTDLLFATPRSFDDTLRIESTLAPTPGFEGAPLCDARGNVIGIVAHHAADAPDADKTYSSRVDLLSELLSGIARESMQARAASWDQKFAAAFTGGLRDGAPFATRAAAVLLGRDASQLEVEQTWEYSLSDDQVTGEFRVDAGENERQRRVICAFASQQPTPIVLEIVRDGTATRLPTEPVAAPYLAIAVIEPAATGSRFSIHARCRDVEDCSKSAVSFFLIRESVGR
jgi:pSer/pThr/pTyr-binding forkhead associated (FHA) protein